ESNLRETSAYLGHAMVYLILSIAAAGALSILTAIAVRRNRFRWQHRSADWIAGITIGVPVLSLVLSLWPNTTSSGSAGERIQFALQKLSIETYATYPFGAIGRFVEYRREWQAMREAAQSLAGFKFEAKPKAHIAERQVYVLVIGEASR